MEYMNYVAYFVTLCTAIGIVYKVCIKLYNRYKPKHITVAMSSGIEGDKPFVYSTRGKRK